MTLKGIRLNYLQSHTIRYSFTGHIQGVSRLLDITVRGDLLGLCDKRCQYKHVSNFGRLRIYDRLKLRIEGNDYDMIYLLTAIGLSTGGSSTVHIYTQTIHRTTQNKQYIEQHNNLGECGPCPVLARFTLAFALQLRKRHGKTSIKVAASKNT